MARMLGRLLWTSSLNLSTPSQPTLWLHPDGFLRLRLWSAKIRALLLLGGLLEGMCHSFLIDTVMRLQISLGIFNTMGLTLSQHSRIFFLFLEPRRSFRSSQYLDFVMGWVITLYSQYSICVMVYFHFDLNFFMVYTSLRACSRIWHLWGHSLRHVKDSTNIILYIRKKQGAHDSPGIYVSNISISGIWLKCRLQTLERELTQDQNHSRLSSTSFLIISQTTVALH